MRVSMNKTKVMINRERHKVRQKAVRWPCGVCSKGVDVLQIVTIGHARPCYV